MDPDPSRSRIADAAASLQALSARAAGRIARRCAMDFFVLNPAGKAARARTTTA